MFGTALRNVARMRTQEGTLHRLIVHIHRCCAVALAEEAVMAHAHTVVAGENDDRILPDTHFFQLVQDLTDTFIHRGDRRKEGLQISPPGLLAMLL